MSRMSASVHRAIPSPEPVRLAATAATRRRRTEQARELAGHGHSVQFYEDDRYLVETVVDFFAAGMVDGQGAVAFVIAGARRRRSPPACTRRGSTSTARARTAS